MKQERMPVLQRRLDFYAALNDTGGQSGKYPAMSRETGVYGCTSPGSPRVLVSELPCKTEAALPKPVRVVSALKPKSSLLLLFRGKDLSSS